ncbi:MAG TPA: hypothetical protein DCP53_08070 [Elusimicrobia bacterium]|nr:hypothetical protein [Elusimicrobiota bacterium]
MRLGISSWSYHRTIEANKIDQIGWIEKTAKELKLDGVELLDVHFPSTDEKYLRKIKKLCTDLHLDIYLLSATTNFGKATEIERKEEVEKLKKWIDIGYYLGVPVVRYFAGVPQGDATLLWKEVIKLTKISVDYASEKGITLALENHHGFIKTSDDVFNLFNVLNSEWLKLCLDTGNFKDLYTSIEKTMDMASIIHAKMYGADGNGISRKLDYNKIFDILKKNNYNGYLSIEYEGESEEESTIPECVKYLRNMMQNYA